MTAQEAVSYIKTYTWAKFHLGLDRIEELLAGIGNPENDLKFIHVAGTNGKGSACAMISSVLEAAGYRTGMFTSPDLVRFTERMRINRNEISGDDLAAITEKIAAVADAMEDHPSEFELSTAIAFQYFKEQKCDVVIVEVGMGGETDSTNVIPAPEAAMIMNIGLEHTDYLGDTLEKIAGVKAGIIKKGSKVVAYPVAPSVNAVFRERCREKGADYTEADFGNMQLISRDEDGQHIVWRGNEEYTLRLPGEQQLHNAAVVLTAIEALRSKGWEIPQSAVKEGLANVFWPVRFEILAKDPCVIVDGSHNPQCVQALADNLQTYFAGRQFVCITGVLADKDYPKMLGMLRPFTKKFLCVTPDNHRALSADKLAEYLRSQGAEAESFDTYEAALDAAGIGTENVVACGSLYMTGLLREMIVSKYIG